MTVGIGFDYSHNRNARLLSDGPKILGERIQVDIHIGAVEIHKINSLANFVLLYHMKQKK